MTAEQYLLTSKEVSEILKLHPTTVMRWYRRGILPGVLLNQGRKKSCVRFRGEDVKRLIRNGLAHTATRVEG